MTDENDSADNDGAGIRPCPQQVLMTRSSDVRLELGFHCVVNRSQKNINDGMGREELWAKEKSIFTKNDRMKRLPEKNWGTLRLMEKVAKIQEARVDECLPKIKEAVRKRTVELREELRRLPAQAETEADQFRLFNSILTKIRGDLARRIRAEFMSAEASDRELTIAPIVASKVQKFRQQLVARNPDWLGQDMIDSVTDSVQTFVQGYTVDNLTGPHVFINLIKQIFVEEGLLKDSVHELVMDVGEHLRKVVEHVIGVHGDINGVLSNRLDAKAEECIDRLTCEARDMCEMLAEAQQVTSTTHGDYMVQLTRFRKSWLHEAFEDDAEEQEETGKDAEEEEEGEQTNEGQNKLPAEFLSLVKDSKEEPQKLTVLEICASLHVYTKLMIEGFAEMSAKLIKFNMVEQLADKLEEIWREELGGSNLHELFPRDGPMVQQQEDLKRKISILSEFKDRFGR